MLPPDNPYIQNEDFRERLENCLPSNHPSNENPPLTTIQSIALPIFLWFFDSKRNLGAGRTYLLARVIIELALRGHRVNVEDVSSSLTLGPNQRKDENLCRTIIKILQKDFPKHIYEYNASRKTFIIKGVRP